MYRKQIQISTLLFIIVLLACSNERATPVVIPTTITNTSIPPTSTSTILPSITPSPTARPKRTSTPLPSWVTDFAEPILAAIKDRAPDFEDDFSTDTGKWHDGYGFQKHLVIDQGVMGLIDGDHSISNYYFLYRPNIVLQADVLLPLTAHAAIDLASNSFESPDPLKLQLDPNNFWSVRLHGTIVIANGTYQIVGQKTQLMYIVKGSRVAFYINQNPVAYFDYPKLLEDTKNERLFNCGDTCYFDNVKVWDLDRIPNLP